MWKASNMKRILIIDDHEVLREGVKRIFDKQPGTFVFGEAGTAPQALKLARDEKWDVAVLDLNLGGRDGLELLKELKQIHAKLPVLILSMHSEELFARRAFKAGAAGYITKNSPRAELVKAISKVIEGGTYVDAGFAERFVVDVTRGADRPIHDMLSDREFEVMRLIGSGKTVSEIADHLSLSVGTISTYRARILDKTGMKTNAELTHYAIQNKLVD